MGILGMWGGLRGVSTFFCVGGWNLILGCASWGLAFAFGD